MVCTIKLTRMMTLTKLIEILKILETEGGREEGREREREREYHKFGKSTKITY